MAEDDLTRQERFWSKVDIRSDEECWLWKASVRETGYGQFKFLLTRPKMERAHRAAWMLANGPIPNGLNVLHSCDVRACVNPSHLRIGTQKENIQEMVRKGRGKAPSYKGSKHPNSKLDEALISEIRQASGTLKEIGLRFGVHLATVGRIRQHKAWVHV